MYAQPQTLFVVMPRGIGYPITRYGELEMEDEGGNNRLIKFQNAFLSRDGLRCLLTGMPDCEQTYHGLKYKGVLNCSRVVHIISSILAGPHSGLFREALCAIFLPWI